MIGRTLSHYKIVSKLGEGGMGEVYLAEDTELGRKVALKVLPEAMASNPERLERFRREARAVAALDHPNIVTIFNVEEASGRRLLVMELIDGESLDRVVPPQGLPLARVFEIAVPMADALAAAHDKGITHRDLKPSNVMVTSDGRVKVLDFGLAKLALETAGTPDDDAETELAPVGEAMAAEALTGEGTVMGTAPYMSPEQLQGKPVDSRTDIFSLGIVLYEMTTGQRPFRGESGLELASSILKDAPSAVTEIRTDLPRHLGRIVQHCLEKDPERRFQSIKDVRNELEGLRDEVRSGSVATGSHPVVPVAAPGTEPAAQVADSDVPSSPPTAAPAQTAARLEAPSDPATTSGSALTGATTTTEPSRNKGLLAAIAVVLLLGVGAGIWWTGRPRDTVEPVPAAESQQARSIAVLPFADLSAEKDQEYFTDGMTEELLSALGKIEGLKVPSRTAVFALKDKGLGIAEVGDRLGVATVLEGSVRKSGDRLRISTQLVQVSDGFQLWSETYDRELRDVFTVQDEIAQSIAAALRVTLTSDAGPAQEIGGTTNPEAYDFFLQGNQYLDRNSVDLMEYATQMYEKAIVLDPDYALAWARLAFAQGQIYGWTASGPGLVAMERASAKALELEPRLAEAHSTRALYYWQTERPEAALREYEEALRLDDQSAPVYFAYGNVFYMQGDLERAAELWERSIELDPEDRLVSQLLPQLYVSLGREEEALKAYRRALAVVERYLELNPDDLNTRLHKASSLLALGQREEAFDIAEAVLSSDSQDVRVLYNTACFYSLAGEKETALEALEMTAAAGYSNPEWPGQDSDLDNIRSDPRFDAILKRMEANRKLQGSVPDQS